jgi:hypothetical protein
VLRILSLLDIAKLNTRTRHISLTRYSRHICLTGSIPMSYAGVSTPWHARWRAGGPYPHSCRVCADLVIDARKLSCIGAMRFKYGWLRNLPLRIPMGMTIAEANRASQSCSFFRSIMTRGGQTDLLFRDEDAQLYWWLGLAKHTTGLCKVEIAPLDRGSPLDRATFIMNNASYTIYAIRGTLFPAAAMSFWLT